MQPWLRLKPITEELVARLHKELNERGPAASGTEKRGGVVMAGIGVQQLFAGMLLAIAEQQRQRSPLANGKPLDRATAGDLLRALRDRASGLNLPGAEGRFLQAVCARDSCFWRFVNHERNPAAHDQRWERDGGTMREMLNMLRSFRREMGWEP